MAYVINCTDGVVVRGETMDELLDNALAHVQEAHPDQVDTLGREQLRSMAQEV